MIKSIGTFSAAIVVATTMAISTAQAAPMGPSFVEAIAPTPTFRSSLLSVFGNEARRSRDLLLQPVEDGSVWNASSHARAWQSLVMRSHRDDTDADHQLFFRLTSVARQDVQVRDSYSPWTFDDIKLVAPAHTRIWADGSDDQEHAESMKFIEQCVGSVDHSLLNDAAHFYSLIKDLAWAPDVWADEGEIAFEWIDPNRHAVVSIEGDGRLGYTMRKGDVFVSGSVIDAPVSILPEDLREYLS